MTNTNVKVNSICCTCLSTDRKLLKLEQLSDGVNLLYSLISFDDEAVKEAFHKDITSLHIMYMCWECRAIVNRTNLFRKQAVRALRQLTDICEGSTDKTIRCLSNLSMHTSTDSINTIYEESNNFIDCGEEIKSEIDDELPLSELKFDNSETDNQNGDDNNSDCDNYSEEVTFKSPKRKLNSDNNKVSDLLLDISDTDYQNDQDNSACDNNSSNTISIKTKLKTKRIKNYSVKNDKVSNEVLTRDGKVNVIKCKPCGIEFETKTEYRRHYLKCPHKKRRKLEFPCRKCELNFEDAKQRWRHHQKVHAEKHKCSMCTKSFTFRSYLLIHEKHHLSPPPREECPVCHKMIRADLVKTHSLTHTDREVYKCVSCDKIYVCRVTYDNHMKYSKAHAQVELKRYKCVSCDKCYRYQSELRDHVNYQHKNQTEHKCPICEKGYATKRCLYRHIKRTHEGIKERDGENICHLCGKSFTERCRLLEHERIHSGSRPLSCELCGHTFRQRAALYTHRKRVHKLVTPQKVVTVLGKDD